MGGINDYLVLRDDNERLVAENTALRNRLLLYKNADTLKPRILATTRGRYTLYPARVANATTNKQYNYLSLNIGENAGIHRDMGVIANGSVVGIVVNTSANFATVMPLLNRNTKISARHKRSGHIGSLMWNGIYYRSAILTEVPQHAEVATGDTIVTSGFSALFPEGILIGTVIDYTVQKGSFYNINIRLATDFNTLRYVEIIDNKLQVEQHVLEEEQKNF
jgi:rod shape-determining protein MreC